MVETEIPEVLSAVIRSELDEIIEKKLESKNYEISVSSAATAGESNFIGIVYRVSFNKVGEDKQEKMILKIAPQQEIRRNQFRSRLVFLQEINVYNQILPYFRKFQESKGVVDEENGFFEYPECFRTVDVEPDESLFLEDLSVRGFSIIDRYTQDVTADHAYLVMKSLGKLHAISFALKDQQPEKLKELLVGLKEMMFVGDDAFLKDFFDKQVTDKFKIFNSDEDAHLLAKINDVLKNGAFNACRECLDVDGTDSGSVISHGDCWQNNLMFRYDENGIPIEISLLDWQISRYSSPVIDIVYFIFCCTTKELRDAHYDNFLKVYHESLSAHIRRLGSDPDTLFSYEMMQDHFRKYAKFGLIMSTAVLPVITSDRGKKLDLDEFAENFKASRETNEDMEGLEGFFSEDSRNKFEKRLRGVVVDMDRFGYI